MPKQKAANSERYKKYIREFGNNMLRYECLFALILLSVTVIEKIN